MPRREFNHQKWNILPYLRSKVHLEAERVTEGGIFRILVLHEFTPLLFCRVPFCTSKIIEFEYIIWV